MALLISSSHFRGLVLKLAILLASLLPTAMSLAQEVSVDPSPEGTDPCGYPDTTTALYRAAAAVNWGYGYDSLLVDLGRWKQSPYVRVDSVGASVQLRALYMLTIEDTVQLDQPRTRIWIHARTHPNEVQGTWVTNQIVSALLSGTTPADELRRRCVFNIMPMYNPDGVELQLPRQNANGVDIESNWAAIPGEPEVQVLRSQFQELMSLPNPIVIALNMHSAYNCTRYFVYHAASGTSPAYAAMEQQYIGYVQAAFPGRIQPWNYFISWTSGAPSVYPESWFWYNHGERVLALTYEDMNCPAADGYDTTARAILYGIRNQLFGPTGVASESMTPEGLSLSQNYPNPFNPTTVVRFHLPASGQAGLPVVSNAKLVVYDMLGREMAVLLNERKEPGEHEVIFDGSRLPSGVYVCRLTAGANTVSRKMMLLK